MCQKVLVKKKRSVYPQPPPSPSTGKTPILNRTVEKGGATKKTVFSADRPSGAPGEKKGKAATGRPTICLATPCTGFSGISPKGDSLAEA